jgi:DUF2934 family protein
MPETYQNEEQAIRERAYFIWEREGRPEGRAGAHWALALAAQCRQDHGPEDNFMADEQGIVDGTAADFPALMTKDVPGG